MGQEIALKPSNIILYQNEANQRFCGPQLKNFLQFLKACHCKRPFRFSYLQKEMSLLPQLSVKENIQLDCIDPGLAKDKENKFDQLIKNIENQHLKFMLEQIGDLKQQVSQLTLENQKLASIVKALLKQNIEYLLIDKAEEGLSDKSREHFILAVAHICQNSNQKAIIHSNYHDLWLPISTHQVAKSSAYHYQFQATRAPVDRLSNVAYIEEWDQRTCSFSKKEIKNRAA